MLSKGAAAAAAAIAAAAMWSWTVREDAASRAAPAPPSRAIAATVGPAADVEVAANADRPGPLLLTHTLRVRPGDTLGGILKGAGVPPKEATDATQALRPLYDLRRMKTGLEIALTLSPACCTGDAGGDGRAMRLLGLSLEPDPVRSIGLVRSGDGFTATQSTRPTVRVPSRAAGEIESSLYAAAEEAQVPPTVLAEVIHAFSFDVDFQREIKPGDRFEILYVRLVGEDGAWVANGNVIAAALVLGGTRRAIYRHTTAAGRMDYFDDKGASVRKALLRTPIDGARLSSGYGDRMHPILGYTTQHRGVDFAAPSGTPIYAAGDGVVQSAGEDGAYGKAVRVRHDGKHATRYAHLSRFASGLRAGRRVRQGEVIGYVGSTGRSTGPHLHFEVLVNGSQVNPLKIKMPPSPRLAGPELVRFLEERKVADRQLADLGAAAQFARTTLP